MSLGTGCFWLTVQSPAPQLFSEIYSLQSSIFVNLLLLLLPWFESEGSTEFGNPNSTPAQLCRVCGLGIKPGEMSQMATIRCLLSWAC